MMPAAVLACDALTKADRTGLVRSVPGDPLASPGLDLSSKIRVPVPTVLFRPADDTPGRCWECAGRAGMGGRGLSHPQELPLIATGAAEPCQRPGPAGGRGHERLIGWRCL